jgi:hypothetical protein
VAEEFGVDEAVLLRVSGWPQKEIGFWLLECESYCAGAVG